jgi:UDP-3-O-acyl N-acetylglucosamine deacetylase
VKKLGHRYQRTLASAAQVQGVGFLTGASVTLRFLPAPAETGIVFVRTDCSPNTTIPAHISQVTGSNRRTTLGEGTSQVSLVEHVLAALAGLRIDNCVIELDASEPPGLDGSAKGFVEPLRDAGVVLQRSHRDIYGVESPVTVEDGLATLTLHPGPIEELKISYVLDYGADSPIGRQSHTQVITPESFANELADCRTYLFEVEALEFRRQGLGARLTTADLLVIGSQGPINNRYRHANELVRHKVLDIVGDLALLGHDLCGHLVAYRSGHPLNAELARKLVGEENAQCQPTCSATAIAR